MCYLCQIFVCVDQICQSAPRSYKVNGYKQYPIKRILDRKFQRGYETQYLVDWVGSSPNEYTWENESRICDTTAFKIAKARWDKEEKRMNRRGIYFIEAIKAECLMLDGQTKYHVLWRGYPDSEATWEPYSAVKHSDAFEAWIQFNQVIA